MKWLEIIELRAARIDKKLLSHKIALLKDESRDKISVKIYKNARVETDWCIHLLYESETLNPRGSEIAIRLKESLKELGMINYGIWGEENFK
jgi:hypothetical protein